MKKKNKIIIAILTIFFLITISIVGIIIYINNSLNVTEDFINGKICKDGLESCEVTPFIIEEGSYGIDTLNSLAEKGIIKDANIVNYWNKIFGGYDFYAGYYEIPHTINNNPINLEQLLAYLSNPANGLQDTVNIKLDEGDFVKSFAYEIAEQINFKDFDNEDINEKTYYLINCWNNEEYIRELMEDYPFLTDEIFNDDIKIYLEGYLFPDTYEFYVTETTDNITRKILNRTLDVYNKYIDEFNSSKLTTHEIFTLASIVQWETGDPEDSLLVAGAFLNRMEDPEIEGTGGKLQSTVTACYAFNLSKSECDSVGDTFEYTQQENPYNTYLNKGFPPGPVCCPNEISINAALNPNQEDGYIYFVADMCNGGTKFAKTLNEHDRNINTYYIPCSY